MTYLISTFCLLGFYSLAINLNTFYYKSKTNIVQNIFAFTSIFFFIYLATSYLFIFQINSKNISVSIAVVSFLFGLNFFLSQYKYLKEIFAFRHTCELANSRFSEIHNLSLLRAPQF